MERIKRKIKEHLDKDEGLLKHSIIIFCATMIANIFSYLYQLYMGRALGPEGFGVLGAMFSIIYIFAAPVQTVQTVVTNFTSRYKAHNDLGKIRQLLVSSSTILFGIGIILSIIFFIAAKPISDYLQITILYPVIFLGMFNAVNFVLPVLMGVLVGLQKFKSYGAVSILSSLVKLLVGILIVSLGYAVSGAMFGLVLYSVLAVIIIIIPILFLFKYPSEHINLRNIYKYSFPVFISLILLMCLSNIDVILVKHYFSPHLAGYYVATSIIGKIIFFASSSLIYVMFPKVSELHASNKHTHKILKNTLFYVLIISLAIVFMFFIAPDLIVFLFFGRQYNISMLIGIYGIAMTLFSLNNLLVMYNLSIRRFGFVLIFIPLLALEILSIYLFHDTLITIIKIVTVIMLLAFVSLLFYNRKELGFDSASIF